ncbi:hypothetical protein [Arsukibacterium perlucidum]|uniref:hypothetical protein n=1 Tax=Arsukibacterium perlucidum TaxID=368811 RepID=UPI000370658D|nr:hypothetical protein [Arsukibacterium perlucidum]
MKIRAELRNPTPQICKSISDLIQPVICASEKVLDDFEDTVTTDRRYGNYSRDDIKWLKLLTKYIQTESGLNRLATMNWELTAEKLSNVLSATFRNKKEEELVRNAINLVVTEHQATPNPDIDSSSDSATNFEELAIKLNIYALCDLCEAGCRTMTNGQSGFHCKEMISKHPVQECGDFKRRNIA